MSMTKQQILEWAAIEWDEYPKGSYIFTREEWQQELDKMQKQQGNSWHERGELPPVGAICEMIDDKNTWLECEIIAHKNSFCIGWISSINAPFYTDDKSEFRPLRTEREKAIDEMIAAIDHIKEGNFQTFIGALYDAGYRKVKP